MEFVCFLNTGKRCIHLKYTFGFIMLPGNFQSQTTSFKDFVVSHVLRPLTPTVRQLDTPSPDEEQTLTL